MYFGGRGELMGILHQVDLNLQPWTYNYESNAFPTELICDVLN